MKTAAMLKALPVAGTEFGPEGAVTKAHSRNNITNPMLSNPRAMLSSAKWVILITMMPAINATATIGPTQIDLYPIRP